MISQTFTVSAFDSGNEVEVTAESSYNNKRMWDNSLLRPVPAYNQTIERTRPVESQYLSSSKTEASNLLKPCSLPNGFLTEFSSRKSSLEEDSSMNSLSSHEYDEDTDSDFCSKEVDEDELANEMKSRNEADDELASLFESDSSCASEP